MDGALCGSLELCHHTFAFIHLEVGSRLLQLKLHVFLVAFGGGEPILADFQVSSPFASAFMCNSCMSSFSVPMSAMPFATSLRMPLCLRIDAEVSIAMPAQQPRPQT